MGETERRQNKSTGDFAHNKVYVCVDQLDGGGTEIGGRVFHDAIEEVQPFLGVDQLLLRVEELLDEQNYPAASTESRHFGKQKDLPNSEKGVQEPKMFNKEKGEKATFVIQVQYRQNATWQGHVTWVEKDLERPFRSALELIKLLDSSYSNDESEQAE